MSTLHVLLPTVASLQGDALLRQWLAHGDRLLAQDRPRESVLRSCFHFAGATFPVAALRHHCHAADASVGAWVCADPAWVRSEATGARLLACPVTDIAADEAEQLAEVLRPLFGDAGVPLAIDTPSEWCARLLHGAPPVRFVDPADALGADLLACLPEGQAARLWRRLFNEAQVALHAHPVNAARIAAGKRPVNALWFWGAGALPDPVESTLQVVASVDDSVRGLAKLAGALRVEPASEAIAAAGSGAALLDLDFGTPATLDLGGEWLPHFRSWLRKRRFATIELTFTDGERWRLRHAHRLRFWRRR